MSWIKDRVGTAAMIREMDRRAIEDFRIPGLILMENAGRAAYEILAADFGPCCVNVLAGKGNNGGDGFVIARHLLNAGVKVRVFVFAQLDEVRADARVNLDALLALDAPVSEVLDRGALEDYRYPMADCDVIVDALLGTGIRNEVQGFLRDAIDFVNEMVAESRSLKVFSVDLPSGVHADTGQVLGAAIRADATVTFGAMKTGLLSYPGADLCGDLSVVDISLPRELYITLPYRMITADWAARLLPSRRQDSHKGSVGHGLVIAGCPGKTGAAVMAAQAGLRAGAGLITLAGPASVHQIFEAKTLEVMTEPLPDTDGLVGRDAIDRALCLMDGKTAVAIGPGLGLGAQVREFIAAIVSQCQVPLIIDADGLAAVAHEPAILATARCPVILTPHPGEMARLLGAEVPAVMADRLNLALEYSRRHNVTLAMKGAHTIVACPDGRACFNLTGNAGMATGGSGDVLTGTLLGLLCHGLEAPDATALAVCLHGIAGDLAAEERGETGLIAGDILDHLPRAFLTLAEANP